MKGLKHTKSVRASFGDLQKRMTECTFRDKNKYNRKLKHKKS